MPGLASILVSGLASPPASSGSELAWSKPAYSESSPPVACEKLSVRCLTTLPPGRNNAQPRTRVAAFGKPALVRRQKIRDRKCAGTHRIYRSIVAVIFGLVERVATDAGALTAEPFACVLPLLDAAGVCPP